MRTQTLKGRHATESVITTLMFINLPCTRGSWSGNAGRRGRGRRGCITTALRGCKVLHINDIVFVQESEVHWRQRAGILIGKISFFCLAINAAENIQCIAHQARWQHMEGNWGFDDMAAILIETRCHVVEESSFSGIYDNI